MWPNLKLVISIIAMAIGTFLITFSEAFTLTKQKMDISPENPFKGEESEGSISLNRVKRLDNENEEEHSLELKLQAFDKEYKVKLMKPRNSIFSPDFQFQTSEIDLESKLPVVRDVTPSKEEMNSIEDGHRINPEQNTAISINGTNGKIQGIVQDVTFSSTNGNKSAIIVKKPEEYKNPEDYVDYEDSDVKFTKRVRGRTAGKKVEVINPEILIVFCNRMYERHHGKIAEITDYAAVLFHGINNRYTDFKNPRIQFIIAGVHIMKSQGAQKRIFGNNHLGQGYNIYGTLHDFGFWLYENLNTLPKHDMAILITGEEFVSDLGFGRMNYNIRGVSPCPGACEIRPKEKTVRYNAVSEDSGNFFGLIIIAHELAHNLGAPHDGVGKSAGCNWKWGYLMSYMGHGEWTKFHFSTCSIKTIKEYTESDMASCLYSRNSNAKIVPIASANIGQRVSMTDMCRQHTQDRGAYVNPYKDPNTLCTNVHCISRLGATALDLAPGDDAYCGNRGKCWKGKCINKINRMFLRV